MRDIVPEIDVLIASAVWLWKDRNVLPLQFSVAIGKGIDMNSDKKRLQEALEVAGVPKTSKIQNSLGIHPFPSSGPDIIGLSSSEFWQIECKGSGTGTKQTQRNNFDRALASVVSYYIDEFIDFKPFIGLALPSTNDYISELQRRVKKSLRRQLNMWILLYDSTTQLIRPISPDNEYD